MTEIWKDVKDYEGFYQVSNLGRVKSLDRFDRIHHHWKGKMLKLAMSRGGYLAVELNKNGKASKKSVHRLVAEVFVPNPLNKSMVNHLDGIKTHNTPDNLEWCTDSENKYHAYRNGLNKGPRGELQGSHKLTWDDIHYIREHYKPKDKQYSTGALGKKFNVRPSTIYKIITYQRWREE